MKSLNQKTVVITGASSGVGRAAAEAFAREGARLVLAARHQQALDEVAEACRRLGGEAEVVLTDVGEPQAVQALADEAIRRFGGIDVWINNAGVGAVGEFTETPIAAHERVIRTNLLGYLHGAHSVLPHFKQRQAGVLINTLSVGAWAAAPYAAAYSASKYGLRGLSEALRAELGRYPGIHVCDVFPAFLDTPGVSHAANYTGKALKPIPPLYDPRKVADAMVRLARHPRSATVVGPAAGAIRLGHLLAPSVSGGVLRRAMDWYFGRAEPAASNNGILFEPALGPRAVDGGWRQPGPRKASLVVAGVALLGAGLWLASRRAIPARHASSL